MNRILCHIAVVALCGCSSPDSMSPELRDPTPRGDDDPVAAVVDGEPIYLSRVLWLSEQTDRSPREVLEGMVDMTLLAHEARRRGLLATAGVKKTYKKALVQELLVREVEDPSDPDSVTVDDIRTFYVANYANKGILLENAWHDIWDHLVAQKRRTRYDELLKRAREHFQVSVDQQNVEQYLGRADG